MLCAIQNDKAFKIYFYSGKPSYREIEWKNKITSLSSYSYGTSLFLSAIDELGNALVCRPNDHEFGQITSIERAIYTRRNKEGCYFYTEENLLHFLETPQHMLITFKLNVPLVKIVIGRGSDKIILSDGSCLSFLTRPVNPGEVRIRPDELDLQVKDCFISNRVVYFLLKDDNRLCFQYRGMLHYFMISEDYELKSISSSGTVAHILDSNHNLYSVNFDEISEEIYCRLLSNNIKQLSSKWCLSNDGKLYRLKYHEIEEIKINLEITSLPDIVSL